MAVSYVNRHRTIFFSGAAASVTGSLVHCRDHPADSVWDILDAVRLEALSKRLILKGFRPPLHGAAPYRAPQFGKIRLRVGDGQDAVCSGRAVSSPSRRFDHVGMANIHVGGKAFNPLCASRSFAQLIVWTGNPDGLYYGPAGNENCPYEYRMSYKQKAI
jgi:hypothetical protein